MKKSTSVLISGVFLFALFCLAVQPVIAQNAVRQLRERVEANLTPLSGAPPGPFGDYRVHLNQNALVDSYDSRVGPYDPDNPGENSQVASNCNPNDDGSGVKLEENSVVLGDISVTTSEEEGRVNFDHNSTFTGQVNYNVGAWELKPISMPDWHTTAGGGPEGEIIGTTGDKPGEYEIISNSFRASNNAVVTFEPGVYHFDHLELKNNVSFNIGGDEGMVEIYVGGSITFENNSELLPPIEFVGDTTRLRIYYDGTSTVDLSNNVKFFGFIYAPNALIEVRNNDQIYGNLVGKEVFLWNNAAVHYDEALGDQDFSHILGPPARPPTERLDWQEVIAE